MLDFFIKALKQLTTIQNSLFRLLVNMKRVLCKTNHRNTHILLCISHIIVSTKPFTLPICHYLVYLDL